ncbi:Uncharacterized protein TPAR_03001 [Tolypocladium paradoxum]|uniref:Uncharacterized protein n=1 Tax=Tolypocladium paradoxum TaxID=94208 RepID=A0A2S4L2Y4_9HYPO|nr:Uncharacterized protein TPAR_03001 [Tolypocladium paradoxum]
MRSTFVTVVAAAPSGSALSAPTGSRNPTSASVVGGLEDGLPVGQVEQELQGLLGGSLASIVGALGGLPVADKLLSLVQGGKLAGGDLTASTPVDAVNSYLDISTGDVVYNLEETLGLENVAGLVTGVAGGML